MSLFNHFQHINLTNDQNNALVKIQDFLTSDENDLFTRDMRGVVKQLY